MSFPASPSDGERYQNYTYDATKVAWSKTPVGNILTYYKELDSTDRTFSGVRGTWVDGMSWPTMVCKGAGMVDGLLRIVGRNDSTAWGGLYTNVLYRYDLREGAGYTGWLDVGSSGYDICMQNGTATIASATYPFNLNFSSGTDAPFDLQIKTQHYPYDGIAYVNSSHACSDQMFSSLTMHEIAV